MTDSLLIAVLLLVISLAVCLGGIWALLRQKVIVSEQGEITSVEIPFFGKIKTNYPSLIAIFLGIALAAFVWQRYTIEQEMMPVNAKITLQHPSSDIRKDVFLGIIPQEYHVFENGIVPNTSHDISIQVRKPGDYQFVVYTVTGIDADGFTERVVEHGRVKVIGDFERGEFDATLRVKSND